MREWERISEARKEGGRREGKAYVLAVLATTKEQMV